MNWDLITKMGNILAIPCGIVAIAAIVSFLYNLFSTPKLKYAVKKYQISDEKYFYICCLWNPLYKKIVRNNITKNIDILTYHQVEELNILKYTDKSLEKIINDNGDKISIDFDEFPCKSNTVKYAEKKEYSRSVKRILYFYYFPATRDMLNNSR